MKFNLNQHTVRDVKQAYCDEHDNSVAPDKLTFRVKTKNSGGYFFTKELTPDNATLASLGITGRIVVFSMSNTIDEADFELLEKNPNAIGADGHFVLKKLLCKGKFKNIREDIMKKAYQNGLDLHCLDHTRTSMLYVLASHGTFIKQFSYCFTHKLGKDKNELVKSVNVSDSNVLEGIIGHGNPKALKEILRNNNARELVKNFRSKGNNLLHYSLYHKKYEITKLLLSAFPSLINKTCNIGVSPLELICISDNYLVIKYIIGQNMFITKNDDFAQQVMNTSLLYKSKTIIDYLLNELKIAVFYPNCEVSIDRIVGICQHYTGHEMFETFQENERERQVNSIKLIVDHVKKQPHNWKEFCDYITKNIKPLSVDLLYLILEFIFEAHKSQIMSNMWWKNIVGRFGYLLDKNEEKQYEKYAKIKLGIIKNKTFDIENDSDDMTVEYEDNKEKYRKENYNALITNQKYLCVAKNIILTENIFSFCGKILKLCPTRGGKIFDNVCSLLFDNKINGHLIPLYDKKLKIIMTGKYASKHKIISVGLPWIRCPLNNVIEFKSVIGDKKWKRIEKSMHGMYGHRYRESDIPNRHGHCNSNPNLSLVQYFSGFGV